MRQKLADIVHLSHGALVLFVCFAWLAPLPHVWAAHLVLIPLMVLQWRCNQDMCLLTNLEHWLRSGLWYPAKPEPGRFVKSLYRKLLHTEPTDSRLRKIIYGTLLLSGALSGLRLLLASA